MSEQKKNIYQRINDVIAERVYVKRGSAGQGTGVLYDEVIALLSPLLQKHGIVFSVEKVGESRSRTTSPKGHYIYEADFNIHYINIDDPNDRFSTLLEAHAMDAGDKAPGKAVTYVTKISLIKVFQIETGINDEAREESTDKPISKTQAEVITKIFGNDEERIKAFCFSHQIESLSDIPKYDFKGACEAAKKAVNGGQQ